jgi:two-component system chemotaxis response regulator CheY
MLTTENDPNMKSRGKAAGVKGWIVKPFNGASALGAIQKLVAG